MKKLLLTLLSVIACLCLVSCAASKKNVPESRTYIVPDVSRISFEKIELKDAPKVVQDIAKVMENRDACTWTQIGSNAYLIASQGAASINYDLEFDEVLQRLPEQGFTWLDVRLKYSVRGQPRKSEEPVFRLARADVNNPPKGVGFSFSGMRSGTAAPAELPAQGVSLPSPPAAEPAAKGEIEQPVSGQTIESPVKVTGKIPAKGQMRIRISTNGGQIIKEENLSTDPKTGNFSASIKYSPPGIAVSGLIEIISLSNGEETVLAHVPVIIK